MVLMLPAGIDGIDVNMMEMVEVLKLLEAAA